MKIKEVMKTPRTIDLKSNIKQASVLMDKHKIGSLLIVKGNRLVGIMTESDVISKVSAKNKLPSKVLVEDVMSSKVITVDSDQWIDEAVYLMLKNKIKKLPVLEGKQLAGIITSSDIVSNSEEIGQYYFFD